MLILCTMLKSLYRPDVLLSILLTFKLIRRGLLACLPTTLLVLTDCFLLFWWRGFSSQVASFPYWCEELFCCLHSFFLWKVTRKRPIQEACSYMRLNEKGLFKKPAHTWGYTKKAYSRSLLIIFYIKNYQCLKEEIKLIVFLAIIYYFLAGEDQQETNQPQSDNQAFRLSWSKELRWTALCKQLTCACLKVS